MVREGWLKRQLESIEEDYEKLPHYMKSKRKNTSYIFYRTKKGDLLVRHSTSFIDVDGNIFYCDLDGFPYKDNKKIDGDFVKKMIYFNKEDYCKDFPGEFDYYFDKKRFGLEVSYLAQTYPCHKCIKGNFLWVQVRPGYVYPEKSKSKVKTVKPRVTVTDGDDFDVVREFDKLSEALYAAEDLEKLVPFTLSDLSHFGYKAI